MKDAHQKEMISRHFGARGWYTQIETPVFFESSLEAKPKEITDIDVLALRPGNDLRWELILADCKTRKGQSPVNRALWIKGLMDYYSATSGIIILGGSKNIEKDHKLFAADLNITILHESEFDNYDRSIIYPDGSKDYPVSAEDITGLKNLGERYPKIVPLLNYIYCIAWNEANRIEYIRKVIGELKSTSKEIDPNNNDHIAAFYEACSIFSIGLAECTGIVFNQYLKPDTKKDLDEALRVIIWGGRSQYEFISKLRRELMTAKGVKPTELTLPNWDIFIELSRNLLENPRLAFSLPYLFQRVSVDIQKGIDVLSFTGKNELLLLKFAMLTSQYLCAAAQLPPDFCTESRGLFDQKQSGIVHE